MYLGRSTTEIEAISLVGMVQFYRDMCPRWSHILEPITEVADVPKGRKLFWDDSL